MDLHDLDHFCNQVHEYIREVASIIYFVGGYVGDRCYNDEQAERMCNVMCVAEDRLEVAMTFINKALDLETKKAKK